MGQGTDGSALAVNDDLAGDEADVATLQLSELVLSQPEPAQEHQADAIALTLLGVDQRPDRCRRVCVRLVAVEEGPQHSPPCGGSKSASARSACSTANSRRTCA